MKVYELLEAAKEYNNRMEKHGEVTFIEYEETVKLVALKLDKNDNLQLCSDAILGKEHEAMTTGDLERMLPLFNPESEIIYYEDELKLTPTDAVPFDKDLFLATRME